MSSPAQGTTHLPKPSNSPERTSHKLGLDGWGAEGNSRLAYRIVKVFGLIGLRGNDAVEGIILKASHACRLRFQGSA